MRVAAAGMVIASVAVAIVLYGVLQGADGGQPPAPVPAPAHSHDSPPKPVEPERAPTPRTVPAAAPATRDPDRPDAAPEPTGETCSLFGVVRDAANTPVVGARVVVAPLGGFVSSGEPLGEGVTGPDGGFRFEGVAADGARRFRVTCTHPRYHGAVAVAEPDVSCDLTIGLGGAVRGRVLDKRTGKPIDGATVRLYGRGAPEATATTGPDGGFYLERLKPGLLASSVRVGREHHGTGAVTVEAGVESAVEFSIARRPAFHGIVRDAVTGAPIPTARIDHWARGEVITPVDADGRFTIESGLRGWGRAVAKGYVSKRLDPAEDRGTRERPCVVELDPGAIVTGTVVDAGGASLPEKLRVVARPDGLDGPVFGGRRGVVVREDGTFSLDGVAAGRALRVYAVWHMRKVGESDAFTVAAGDTREVRVTIPPTASLVGRVTDPDGVPVAQAAVRIRASVPLPVATAQTAQDGTYRLERVPTGSMTLIVQASGFAPVERTQVVDAPRVITGVDVRLSRGVSIAGRIEDDLGAPVPKIHVRASRVGADPGLGLGHAQTDAAGRFTIDNLAAGRYRVRCFSDRHHTASSRPTFARAGTDGVVLRLVRNSGAIRGVVHHRVTGHPIGQFRIAVVGAAGGPAKTFSDRQGRFTIDGVPAGTIGVVATTRSGGVSDVVELRVEPGVEPPPIELSVAMGLAIEGVVFSPEGELLTRAQVTVSRVAAPGGVIAHAFTDDDGAFRIDGLRREQVRIDVAHGDGVGVERTVHVTEDLPPQDIRLRERGATLHVTVLAGDRPVERARVSMRRKGRPAVSPFTGRRGRSVRRAPLTDATGQYTQTDLPPGRYRVSVSAPEGYAEADVDVGLESTHTVTLRLR